MVDNSSTLWVVLWDIEYTNEEFFKKSHFPCLKPSIKGKNVPGAFDGIPLKSHIFQ